MKTILRALLFLVGLTQLATAQSVDFNRDVLPILSDRCFHCHGPDESNREADLRLDQQQSALVNRDGYAVVVPDHPEHSDLIARITSGDQDLRMPPLDSHVKPLTKREVEMLRRWIASGARWSKHWAFKKPTRHEVPYADMHPIDAFIRKRLESEGLQLAAVAPRHTLLRRLSFDLTGLPPSQQQLQEFLSIDPSATSGLAPSVDQQDQAYRRSINRLHPSVIGFSPLRRTDGDVVA